jgi:hypothetical protein
MPSLTEAETSFSIKTHRGEVRKAKTLEPVAAPPLPPPPKTVDDNMQGDGWVRMERRRTSNEVSRLGEVE